MPQFSLQISSNELQTEHHVPGQTKANPPMRTPS